MPNVVITSVKTSYATQCVAGPDGIEIQTVFELEADGIELTDEEVEVLMAVADIFGEEAALAVLGL